MKRVLVTGGAGVLGREVVARLKEAGYTPRIMSRRSQPATLPSGVEWAQAEVESGEGLAEAVAGVDVIVHCATSPLKNARHVEVDGTRHVLEQARRANVAHFLYISIVGIDRFPSYPYYRHKLAAEAVIANADVPWSIIRATQFHTLVDLFLKFAARLPIMLLPTDFQGQPIDPGEVAARMVDMVAAEPSGHLPDIGGPEVLRLGDMARVWLDARGMRRPIIHLPLPGKAAYGFRSGYNLCPEQRYGKITWAEWVQHRYAREQDGRLAAV